MCDDDSNFFPSSTVTFFLFLKKTILTAVFFIPRVKKYTILLKTAGFVLLAVVSVAQANEPEISLQGLTDKLQQNVRAFLSLTQESCQSPVWRIKKLFANADGEIDKALRALGYYQPEIVKQLIFTDKCWEARFNISAGDPVRITHLSVQIQGEAQYDSVFKKRLAHLPLKPGDILNHGLYEKIKKDLRSLSQEYGYLDSQFITKSLRVNPQKRQAEIDLLMDSGSRYRFGKIIINQDVLTPEFIHRYLDIKTGDYYSSRKLADTYNELSKTVYFNNVAISPQLNNIENRYIPVLIDLTPKKKHAYSFGLGYDTDIGPLVSAGYKNRRLNREGHNFSINLDISPILSSVQTLYLIPFTSQRQDYVSIGAGYQLENPKTFKSEQAKLSLKYHHLFKSGWKQVLFLDLSTETYTVTDVSNNTTLLIPGGSWQYTESNNPLRPTDGYHLDFTVLSAPETLVSDVTFVQATANAKLISRLSLSGRIISRINLGATLINDFDRLPSSYRFYAGGTETIRGYNYKKLGPVDNQGNVIGGKMLTVASIEYEQFVNESWGIAAFLDVGNAYNINNINIKTGTGLGVRWLSPIGPLRLDFAIPLNETSTSFQIHFSSGAQL